VDAADYSLDAFAPSTDCRSRLRRRAAGRVGCGVDIGSVHGRPVRVLEHQRACRRWQRLHRGNACTETTAVASQIVSAVVPDVSTFFTSSRPTALPPRTRSNASLTFTNHSGYPTTLDSGVKITITHAASAVGAHWSGRISVPVQTYSGKRYGFTGAFNAVVCPPVRS